MNDLDIVSLRATDNLQEEWTVETKLALLNEAAKIEKVRKWAENMVNCGHQLCSMAESCYEERFGQEALDILDGKPLWYEKK